MPKKPSRKTIVNNLDKVFSEYIRRRYAKNGIAECVTCGKKDHWKNLQAGHFMSRKHYATRWDEDNVEVQCMACNVYRYGEQYLFAKHLGEKKADELLAKSRTMVKIKDWELQDMIEIYKKKLLELEQ
jgi:5-methylcytosine-specific restriction endonuclease McrA